MYQSIDQNVSVYVSTHHGLAYPTPSLSAGLTGVPPKRIPPEGPSNRATGTSSLFYVCTKPVPPVRIAPARPQTHAQIHRSGPSRTRHRKYFTFDKKVIIGSELEPNAPGPCAKANTYIQTTPHWTNRPHNHKRAFPHPKKGSPWPSNT